MAGLQLIIQGLLDEGVFVVSGNGRFVCVCGSEIARSSVRKHLKTKKHLEWPFDEDDEFGEDDPVKNSPPLEEKEEKKVEECGICMMDVGIENFHKCRQCVNKHCNECHPRLQGKCPYCRTPFVEPVLPRAGNLDEEDYLYLDDGMAELILNFLGGLFLGN